MSALPSIPKIYTLGHRENGGIFEDIVQVEEKIDGSQFSFGMVDGKLECRMSVYQEGVITGELKPKPTVSAYDGTMQAEIKKNEQ